MQHTIAMICFKDAASAQVSIEAGIQDLACKWLKAEEWLTSRTYESLPVSKIILPSLEASRKKMTIRQSLLEGQTARIFKSYSP